MRGLLSEICRAQRWGGLGLTRGAELHNVMSSGPLYSADLCHDPPSLRSQRLRASKPFPLLMPRSLESSSYPSAPQPELRADPSGM